MESRKRVVPDSVPQFVIDHGTSLLVDDPVDPTPTSKALCISLLATFHPSERQ